MKRKQAIDLAELNWPSKTTRKGTVYEPITPKKLVKVLRALGVKFRKKG